jgi:hypothetical protein
MEEWCEIKEYPGFKISSEGCVMGITRIRKLQPDTKGYLRVKLKNSETKKVHRLVAQAFIPNPLNLPQINHKDGNKQNNRVDNLEWCDNSHNQKHAHLIGLKSHVGSRHPNTNLSEAQALEIRKSFLTKDFTRKMLALKYGVSEHVVKDIRANKRWTHI